MKSHTIFHEFPKPTKEDKAMVDELMADLRVGKLNDAFNKLRDGKLKVTEAASFEIINNIIKLIAGARGTNRENQLILFLMNCFAGGFLDATRFLILKEVSFKVFKWMLSLGADPTGIVEGFSLLMILNNGFVTESWNERFRALIAAGVDVNHRESKFGTLLHMLIANEFFERAFDFINEVNQFSPFSLNFTLVDFEKKTPLLLATKVRSLAMVQRIVQQKIERNADIGINKPDDRGRTPLHYACILGAVDIVKLLLSHGADLTLRDFAGKTPTDYLDQDDQVLIETLNSIEIDPQRDEKALLNNILVNLHSRSELLIKGKKVPSVKQNTERCGKILKQLSPDERRCVQAQLDGFTGKTIARACLEGRVAVKYDLSLYKPSDIKEMKEKANKEAAAVQAELNPALFFTAAQVGKTQEVKRLVKVVDINARYPLTGETALHQACRNQHYGVIDTLSDCKAINPVIKSNAGQTPLQLFMQAHKGKFLGKKRAVHDFSYEMLCSSIIRKLLEIGEMKSGQALSTDGDGNYVIYNSEKEAKEAYNPTSETLVQSVVRETGNK